MKSGILSIGAVMVLAAFSAVALGDSTELTLRGFLSMEDNEQGEVIGAELITDSVTYKILLDDKAKSLVEENYAEYVDVVGMPQDVDGVTMLKLSSVTLSDLVEETTEEITIFDDENDDSDWAVSSDEGEVDTFDLPVAESEDEVALISDWDEDDELAESEVESQVRE